MPAHADFDAQVETLTRINTAELVAALGLGHLNLGRPVLERLARQTAMRIARDMAEFGRIRGTRGLHAGANAVLADLV